MKITLDVDQLLSEGRISREEHARLKAFASEATASLGANALVALGVVAVAGGTIALLESAPAALGLGLAIALAGGWIGATGSRWKLLAAILLPIGSVIAAGGILSLSEGSPAGWIMVTGLCAAGAVLARSGMLAALSVLALLASVGGMTGYGHAMYFLAVEQPALTVALFSVLAALAFVLSKHLRPELASLAVIAARTALFVVNLGFWIGSLWGDDLWLEPGFDYEGGQVVPDWIFALAWAVALIAIGAWASRRNRRWVVNLAATFGAIHFYTQYFERLGGSPAAILVAGLLAIAIAMLMLKYNRRAKGADPRPEPATRTI